MKVTCAVALLILLAVTRSAAAAPPPQPTCTAATVLPARAQHIPANLPAFAYSALNATASNIHLVAKTKTGSAQGEEVALTLGPVVNNQLKVTPTPPNTLTAGVAYELKYTSQFCEPGAPSATPAPFPIPFTATEAVPLPTQIGVLKAQPTVTLQHMGTVQYTIAATCTLSAEMRPWAEAYEFTLLVDGNKGAGTGTTIVGSGTEVEFETIGWCDVNNAASKKHSVQLRAKLPFAPTLGTTLMEEMEFDCPAPPVRNNTTYPVPGVPSSPTTPPPPPGSLIDDSGSRCSVGLLGRKSSSLMAMAASIAVLLVLARRKCIKRTSAASRRT